MDGNLKNRGSTSKLLFSFLTVLLLILPALLFTAPDANAAGTPAGTKIGNQATATYEDPNGNSFLSTSPLVETTVLPVRALTVTPDGDDDVPASFTGQKQNATPGNTVYYSYTLTNLGNAPDSFDISTALGASNTFVPASIAAYHDVNGNGIIDVGDTLLGGATKLGPVNADASAQIIVRYQVPVGAANNQYANVNLIATSVNDISKTDTDNFNQTVVTTNAAVTVVKSRDLATANPGDEITYTLTVSNNGNQAASAIDIMDNIPDNTEFVDGSLATSFGTFTPQYYDKANPVIGTDTPIASSGNVRSIRVFGMSLATSNSRTITFKVRVIANTPGNTVIENFATFEYNNGAALVPDADTNTVQTVINRRSAVLITSPNSNDAIGTTSSFATTNVFAGDDFVGTTTAPTDASVTAANVPAGSFVYFKNQIINKGNTPDTFNITANIADLPAGASVAFFQLTNANNGAANTSPLLSSDGDGIPDTGPINPGEMVEIVTSVFIPAGATNTDPVDPFDAVITATSTNGGAALGVNNGQKLTDTTINRVSELVSPGTIIRNIINGTPDIANHPIREEVTFTTSANGTTVSFPLNVINTGGSNDTFNLSAIGNPAGSTVQFYPIVNVTTLAVAVDVDVPGGGASVTVTSLDGINTSSPFAVGDQIVINGQTLTVGSISGNTITFALGQTLKADVANGATVSKASSTPITSTNSLLPYGGNINTPAVNSHQNILAVVSIPAGTDPIPSPGTDTTFRARSTNNINSLSDIEDHIIISAFRTFTLQVNRSGSAPSPGTLFYEHTITNTGNVPLEFNLSFTGTANPNFSYQTVTTGGSPILETEDVGGPLAKNATYTFQVKVDILSGTAVNTVHNYNIRATDSTDAANFRENTDTTTVVAGFVSLTKSVTNITRPDDGLPNNIASGVNLPVGADPTRSGMTVAEKANYNPDTEAYPGDVLEYTITYTNIGTQDARNVRITDLIPTNSTYVDGSLTVDGSSDDDDSAGAGDRASKLTSPHRVIFYVGADDSGAPINDAQGLANGGTVGPGVTGTVKFRVMVNNPAPPTP